MTNWHKVTTGSQVQIENSTGKIEGREYRVIQIQGEQYAYWVVFKGKIKDIWQILNTYIEGI